MSATGVPQLPLPFHRDDAASFATYIAGDNGEVVEALRRCLGPAPSYFIYLWGASAAGKSHLLCALCQEAAHGGRQTACLPLKQVGPLGPALCEGLEGLDLVCVDDLEAIAGSAQWEQALLHLYNRLRDGGRTLVMTAASSPTESPIALPDLKSRLAWGTVYHLRGLDDAGKRLALLRRAQARGLEVTEEVLDYLLHRLRRDLPTLCGTIDRLDTASLAAQRRLTVPFVRSLLDPGP